jgi:TetR/AcrR family transcriptional regulator
MNSRQALFFEMGPFYYQNMLAVNFLKKNLENRNKYLLLCSTNLSNTKFKQMNHTVTDTEAMIKAAAKKVFLKKGLAGTRLEEIAKEAGIGRTALHYYFRSKEKLFQVVWQEAFAEIGQRSSILEQKDLTVVEKMQAFAKAYFIKSISEPELDIFMLNEFNNNPEIMVDILKSTSGINLPQVFYKEIEKAVKNGELKGDPKQIFITMFSLCIFSFAGKAMMKSMLNLTEAQYLKLMEHRKNYVIEFLATAFK